ncbi:MAG: dTMP kinase [Minisyncoccota bacterium]
MAGTLIVVDGTDGSGKATQVQLLVARLRQEGYRVKTLDFPQYEKNFFGTFIGQCLTGDYGNFASLDPRIASILYAVDRFESKSVLERWLRLGYVVILDRYVSSNQIHQGGKLSNSQERKKFLSWLDAMEFGVFGLPRPNIILYLDVPLAMTKKMLQDKTQIKKSVYLKGDKKDVVESDDQYLANSRASALRLVKKQNKWLRIDCTRRGVLLSREVIAEIIWQKVKSIL